MNDVAHDAHRPPRAGRNGYIRTTAAHARSNVKMGPRTYAFHTARCVLVARRQTFNKEASDCVLGKTTQQYRLLEAAPSCKQALLSRTWRCSGATRKPLACEAPAPRGLSQRKGGRKWFRFQDELPSTSSLPLPLTRQPRDAVSWVEGRVTKGTEAALDYDHLQAHSKRSRLAWALDHVCARAPLHVSDGTGALQAGRDRQAGWGWGRLLFTCPLHWAYPPAR